MMGFGRICFWCFLDLCHTSILRYHWWWAKACLDYLSKKPNSKQTCGTRVQDICGYFSFGCYSAHDGSKTYNLASLPGKVWLGSLALPVFCQVHGMPHCRFYLLFFSDYKLGGERSSLFYTLRTFLVQFQGHVEHQEFVDEWMQMVMDVASCEAGSITCLHHRMTSEHMVIDLWPDSGPRPDELAHLGHLSYTSLFLTTGKFWRKEPTSKASGTPGYCIGCHLSSSGLGWLPKWRGIFFFPNIILGGLLENFYRMVLA